MESTNRRRRRQKGYPCNALRLLIRLWGIITSTVLIGVGIDIEYHGKPAGIYLIFASIVVFILETKWVLTLFVDLLSGGNDAAAYCSCCRRINNFLSGWRLSPFYISLGVALLMWPNSLWLSSVVGIQLLVLAILRLFTVFRYQSNTIKCESLLQKQPTNREYFEKLDNVSDVIDDSMPAHGRTLDGDELIDDV
ncbi:uncharacterized protein LOC116337699 [Contarinia nasturtii]|uniref:uncharacterized protein LOC116337699 n=1 Tax=Contarinia nasturtii TaxID=265458 RepID=UPI0012D4B872|nr:uncharacterized protein LOC116337699 [Contarinia nasturtii]XP_031618335.1 uncharacterized protein LOC116337699 [Contarinia nasturtii]